MNHFSTIRRVVAATGVAAACSTMLFTAGFGSSVAAAASAPPANAKAQIVALPSKQLVFTGFAGSNRVVLTTLADGRYRISDSAPIQAGAGCSVAKDIPGQFAVVCEAPTLSNGTLSTVRFDLGAGNDRFSNQSPVRVRVDGGIGNDVLLGGALPDVLVDASGQDVLRGNGGSDSLLTDSLVDTLPDILDGGSGDDDLRAGAGNDALLGGDGQDVLVGGLGADDLDGGAGLGDTVTYKDTAHNGQRLVITLDAKAEDGALPLGAPAAQSENDFVRSSVEIVVANSGNDVLTGNDAGNTLLGGPGDDIVQGGKGADHLQGGPGNDQLAANKLFGLSVADGAIDTVDGESGIDYCRVPFPIVEVDIVLNCENIDHD